MPLTEEVPITQLPDSLLAAVALDLAQYSIGFLRIEDTPQGQDALLLGSGTLVRAGTTHAILTAHHVLQALPKNGRLGLILLPTLHQHTVDTQTLVYKEIARGTVNSEGPDLGAVILTPSIAAVIAAKKTFYNLDSRRAQLLETPPDRHEGVWFVHGFVDERTVEEPGKDGFSMVKGFYSFSGAGGPDEPPVARGDHDYFAFPVSYDARSVAPTSFGGMSGGGLWQVTLMRDPQGNIHPKKFLLSGVVFYQEETTETQCGVKCHGRSSVYKVAHEAIRKSEP
jgi:hypothetical protein